MRVTYLKDKYSLLSCSLLGKYMSTFYFDIDHHLNTYYCNMTIA